MTQKENMNNMPYVKLSVSQKHPFIKGIALSTWENYYDVKTNCYFNVRLMDNNANMNFRTFMRITAKFTKQTFHTPPYILQLRQTMPHVHRHFYLMNFVIYRLIGNEDFQQLFNNEILKCLAKQTTT